MSFDQIIDRRGSNSSKWDLMETATGVSPDDGIAMWVADMDFAAPDFLQDAVRGLLDKANYGYFSGEPEMKQAVAWWMQERHGWTVSPDAMFSTFGLGNAIAMCLQAFTDPGDEVIIFTPVYHEFTNKINKCERVVKESPLVIRDGVYRMDLDALEASLSGRERVVLFCSPHNPAGRVWSREELRALAAFCARHDLLLISDEIHHDLVYPGQKHIPMAVAAPDAVNRVIMLTSASKTFNIAGARLGIVSVPDEALRTRFAAVFRALDVSPNLLGVVLTQAAYSPRGAEWVDALVRYLDDNQHFFVNAVDEIPGLSAMPMQSTYLAWVDFTNTGMSMDEVTTRVKQTARLAPSMGVVFGSGGENCLRFNLGMPQAQVTTAVERLRAAFSDLQ
ncbi:MalY/PatB family protein [Roseovarius pelagicus]|uniref:Aminotransferase n=1 Tax=Roseovarius pelagicus TaxID=2980108 RepID=A0ABY6DEE9_9RHOB|nr:PatB family C-S lyase [Roseovarius pelagicus]UXX84511.1 PatB family C-S lyase [Roseovarius pelagicus]